MNALHYHGRQDNSIDHGEASNGALLIRPKAEAAPECIKLQSPHLWPTTTAYGHHSFHSHLLTEQQEETTTVDGHHLLQSHLLTEQQIAPQPRQYTD